MFAGLYLQQCGPHTVTIPSRLERIIRREYAAAKDSERTLNITTSYHKHVAVTVFSAEREFHLLLEFALYDAVRDCRASQEEMDTILAMKNRLWDSMEKEGEEKKHGKEKKTAA